MKAITADFVRSNNEANSALILASNPNNGKQVMTSVFNKQQNGNWYDTEQQEQVAIEEMCRRINDVGKYLTKNGAVCEILMGFPDDSYISVEEFNVSPTLAGKNVKYNARINTLRTRNKNTHKRARKTNSKKLDEVKFYEDAFKRMI